MCLNKNEHNQESIERDMARSSLIVLVKFNMAVIKHHDQKATLEA